MSHLTRNNIFANLFSVRQARPQAEVAAGLTSDNLTPGIEMELDDGYKVGGIALEKRLDQECFPVISLVQTIFR